MDKLYNYFFPEEFYPPIDPDYGRKVSKGLERASKLNSLFVGVIRDAERNLLILNHIRGFFNSSKVFLYENDSKDNSKNILEKFSKDNYNVVFKSENLKTTRLADTSLERRTNMANARNTYLEYSKRYFKSNPVDILIVLDLDLLGGFSYTGLLNSLYFWNNISSFGSNSIYYQNQERLYYDTWAYLDSFQRSESDKNLMIFHRGEYVKKVISCFGGMMLYPGNILDNDINYTNEDCDHVTLNKQLINLGYNIWLNPSQITLYSTHYYV